MSVNTGGNRAHCQSKKPEQFACGVKPNNRPRDLFRAAFKSLNNDPFVRRANRCTSAATDVPLMPAVNAICSYPHAHFTSLERCLTSDPAAVNQEVVLGCFLWTWNLLVEPDSDRADGSPHCR